MKRGAKGLRLSFAVIGLVFIAGSLVLHSPKFHNFLLSTIRRGSGWSISIAESKLRLLRGRLEVYGLNLEDPKGNLHVTVDHLSLQVSPLSLIRGKIIVTHLDVDHPVLFLQKDKDQKPIDPDSLFNKLDGLFSVFEKSIFLQSSILDEILLRDF